MITLRKAKEVNSKMILQAVNACQNVKQLMFLINLK